MLALSYVSLSLCLYGAIAEDSTAGQDIIQKLNEKYKAALAESNSTDSTKLRKVVPETTSTGNETEDDNRTELDKRRDDPDWIDYKKSISGKGGLEFNALPLLGLICVCAILGIVLFLGIVFFVTGIIMEKTGAASETHPPTLGEKRMIREALHYPKPISHPTTPEPGAAPPPIPMTTIPPTQ